MHDHSKSYPHLLMLQMPAASEIQMDYSLSIFRHSGINLIYTHGNCERRMHFQPDLICTYNVIVKPASASEIFIPVIICVLIFILYQNFWLLFNSLSENNFCSYFNSCAQK